MHKALIILYSLLIVAILALFQYIFSNVPKPRCADFDTFGKAYGAYIKDFVKYRSLDGDRDGVPCEELLKL